MALVKKKNDSILNMNNAVANLNNNIKATTSNIKNTASAVGSGLQTAYNNAADNIADYLPGFTLLGSTIKNNADLRRYKGDQDKADTELAKYNEAPTYEKSEALQNAIAKRDSLENGDQEIYQKYADPIQNAIDQVSKYSEFKYDVESDPIWNSIKSQYQRNATMGMREAMGDAANLTGGYGSSYSQQAGQQAYQNQIAGMTDIIPELQNSALNVFQANQNGALNQLGAIDGLMENELNNWRSNRAYFSQKVNDMTDQEFNEYLTQLQQWNTDRSFWNEYRNNAIANQQWARQMQADNVKWRQELMYDYVNLGVNSALKVADLGLDAASLGVQAGNNLLDYDLSRRNIAEEQRQFNSLHPDDALPITSPYTQTLNALTGGKSLADLLGGKLSGTGDSGSGDKKSGNDNSKPKKTDDNVVEKNGVKLKETGERNGTKTYTYADGDIATVNPNIVADYQANEYKSTGKTTVSLLSQEEYKKTGDTRSYQEYSKAYNNQYNNRDSLEKLYNSGALSENQLAAITTGKAYIDDNGVLRKVGK